MEASNNLAKCQPAPVENPMRIIGTILALGCIRKLNKDRAMRRQLKSDLQVGRSLNTDDERTK